MIARTNVAVAIVRDNPSGRSQIIRFLLTSDLFRGTKIQTELTALLRTSELTSINLSYANLDRVDFSAFNLKNANLSYANLTGANFKGSDLSGANLFGAKLDNANLLGVNFTNSDLRSTSLKGTMLAGIILCNAKVDAGKITVSTPGTSLNARSGPGVNYPVITSYSDGSVLTSGGIKAGEWIQLTNGLWVSNSWVVDTSNASNLEKIQSQQQCQS